MAFFFTVRCRDCIPYKQTGFGSYREAEQAMEKYLSRHSIRHLRSSPKGVIKYEHIPEVGQRWIENDKRFHRVVEIVQISGDEIHIRTVYPSTDRYTRAHRKRFNGHVNGYSLLTGMCHECQLKAGGKVPAGGHTGITVSLGTCRKCCTADSTLVPDCDYHWPEKGVKAVFD